MSTSPTCPYSDHHWNPGVIERIKHVASYNLAYPILSHVRSWFAQRDLVPIKVAPGLLTAKIVLVLTAKNEAGRLEFFLDYYRKLGVEHFVLIDNESTDNTAQMFKLAEDCSYFIAAGSYARAHYGADWVNSISRRYCRNKWLMWIDTDELLQFSDDPTYRLPELVQQMEKNHQSSLQALMIDMYSDRLPSDNVVPAGHDPRKICSNYDCTGYIRYFDRTSRTTWIKGGVRARAFFSNDPWTGPALNKTPLVWWRGHYAFLRSTHTLWPRSANGTGKVGAALLHFKFTSTAADKIREENKERQHTNEYQAYGDADEKLLTNRATRVLHHHIELISNGLIESAPGKVTED